MNKLYQWLFSLVFATVVIAFFTYLAYKAGLEWWALLGLFSYPLAILFTRLIVWVVEINYEKQAYQDLEVLRE